MHLTPHGLKDQFARTIRDTRFLQTFLDHAISDAPPGRLVISSSNRTKQFFQKTDASSGKGIYIDKKNLPLISALAQKDYDRALSHQLEVQLTKLQKSAALLPDENDLYNVYDSLSAARKELVTPRLLSDKQYSEEWMAVKYSGNPYPFDHQSQQTERGESVRSKSEKIIADKLWSMGIPYRYEYPVHLEDFGTVYPDFTLLNRSTREEVYLEHFGMMDKPEYANKALLKLQAYAKNGIYQGKNLLVSFESRDVPLDVYQLEPVFRELL